ncbi:MAG: cytochrome oxidase subunit III, partial [Saprospiraceae bacterium]|nr:cytochrome oxidase subunit III [Saprospiraceae bacterium]
MAMYGILPKEGAEGRYFALKFALWAGMVSISMMFGAFTSAYLVRKPAGNWYEFKLPTAFLFSTIVLLISSVCF